MKRHALAIGAARGAPAPAEGTPAEEADAARIAEMLRARGFEVEELRGAGATRAGILAGYRRLIERVAPGDAAVVYFSGHGGMVIDAAAPGAERALPRRFQFIAPTDYAETTEDDFRGISAWELSQLLRELTDRTANVTVILDCCHASQMSRDQAAVGAEVRAIPKLTWLGIGRHHDELRRRFGPIDAPGVMGNPRAVRLAACGDWQIALQTLDPQGRRAGLLTQALLTTLAEVGDAPVSWRALGDAIRTRVLRAASMQRPVVEGPVARQLFSLVEVGAASIPIEPQGEALRLGAGRIAGVAVGDVYGVTAIGAAGFTPAAAIARVRVERVEALHAIARRIDDELPAGGAIPPGAVAWPLELALARHAVRIDAPGRKRAALAAAIAGSARLRVATGPEDGVVGELRARGGRLAVLTRDGRPIDPGAQPWSIPAAIGQLDRLAAAQTLLELEGEHGLAEEEVEIEWGTVHPGGVRIPRPAHGAALGLGDRIYLRLHNRAQRPRFAHVFNVGLCGAIKLLSGYAPMGIWLAPGQEELVGIGPDPASPSSGYPLGWPWSARRDEPGVDTMIVIVTAKEAELRALETADPTGARGRAWAAGSPLQRLAAQLHDGGTRAAAPPAADPFFVARRSYVLYPLRSPIAGPGFAVDEDPLAVRGAARPQAWPGAEARRAREIEIRLRGLAAERPVRLDALVCTCSPDRARVLEARTLEVGPGAAPRDGDRLWRGRAQDLVDIYLWAAPAHGGRGLAELLAPALARPAVAEAVDELVVGDDRAPWSLAGGASAALAWTAGELLRRAAPETVGLLHTSFTAAEGHGVGRHPASGLYRERGLGVELGLSIEGTAG